MTEFGMIAIILITSSLVGTLFKQFSLPSVVGQLLTGIILGPALLGIVHPTHTLEFLSELGVVFLMFIAGLESDIDLLKKYFKPSIFVAILGLSLPLILFYFVSRGLNLDFYPALFIGIVFGATSVSITVDVLQEYKKLQTKEGATILGAAVVDDIMAVLCLSIFLTIFQSSQGSSGGGENIVLKLISQLAFLVFVFAMMRYIAPFIMKVFDRLPLFASGTIGAVIICLGMAELAEFCGLSEVIGAFFAGIAVSGETAKITSETIEKRVSVIGYSFFIPIFFASIGLTMNFEGIQNWIPFLILFTILAIITKLFGGLLASKLCGFTWGSGYMIGAGMMSRGEMALIVAQMGFTIHVIESHMYSQLVIVILVTTLLAPFLIKHSFRFISE